MPARSSAEARNDERARADLASSVRTRTTAQDSAASRLHGTAGLNPAQLGMDRHSEARQCCARRRPRSLRPRLVVSRSPTPVQSALAHMCCFASEATGVVRLRAAESACKLPYSASAPLASRAARVPGDVSSFNAPLCVFRPPRGHHLATAADARTATGAVRRAWLSSAARRRHNARRR